MEKIIHVFKIDSNPITGEITYKIESQNVHYIKDWYNNHSADIRYRVPGYRETTEGDILFSTRSQGALIDRDVLNGSGAGEALQRFEATYPGVSFKIVD